MATSDVIREIEIEAARRAALDGRTSHDERFRIRNELRAAMGLSREKRKRGGIAGVVDRNPWIKQVGAVALSAVVPTVGLGLAARVLPKLGGAGAFNTFTRGSGMLIDKGTWDALKAGAKGAVAGAATTIASGLINRIAGGGGPPPLPQFTPQGRGTPIPQPKEGLLGRLASRLLPGGMTGNEWTPVNDMTDRVGRPLAVYPAERTSVVGPAGYVMVTMNGERIAMLRPFAIRAGLYRPPPKPPLSGYDMRAIQRAHSAAKRVKKLAGKVGFRCEVKGRYRITKGAALKALKAAKN